jgi:hypothetical protein
MVSPSVSLFLSYGLLEILLFSCVGSVAVVHTYSRSRKRYARSPLVRTLPNAERISLPSSSHLLCVWFLLRVASFHLHFEFTTAPQMTSRTHFKRKEVDDVMGGEAAWENVDKAPGAFFLPFFSLFPLLCLCSLCSEFLLVDWGMVLISY